MEFTTALFIVALVIFGIGMVIVGYGLSMAFAQLTEEDEQKLNKYGMTDGDVVSLNQTIQRIENLTANIDQTPDNTTGSISHCANECF